MESLYGLDSEDGLESWESVRANLAKIDELLGRQGFKAVWRIDGCGLDCNTGESIHRRISRRNRLEGDRYFDERGHEVLITWKKDTRLMDVCLRRALFKDGGDPWRLIHDPSEESTILRSVNSDEVLRYLKKRMDREEMVVSVVKRICYLVWYELKRDDRTLLNPLP